MLSDLIGSVISLVTLTNFEKFSVIISLDISHIIFSSSSGIPVMYMPGCLILFYRSWVFHSAFSPPHYFVFLDFSWAISADSSLTDSVFGYNESTDDFFKVILYLCSCGFHFSIFILFLMISIPLMNCQLAHCQLFPLESFIY